MDASDACPVYLVPQEIIRNWKDASTLSAIDKPLDSNLARAARDVTAIEKVGDEDDRSVNSRLLRELGEFLNYKKLRDGDAPSLQAVRPAPEPTRPKAGAYGESAILAKISKTYKPQAKRLLEVLSRSPGAVSVDDETGMVTLQGSPLQGSNITQLIQHAVSRSRRATRPLGFEPLLRYVKSQGASPAIFNNSAWRDGLAGSKAVTPRKRKAPGSFPGTRSPLEEGGDSDSDDDTVVDSESDAYEMPGQSWEDVK